MQTIISLVSANMGVALVPASLQNLQRAGVVYKPLEGEIPHVEVAIAWRSDNVTPVLREFLLVVKQHMKKRSPSA
ncbi:MAG TPA: LysR substrate-binding domain-containing protein [Candidatus Sericytochromatia bacterium]